MNSHLQVTSSNACSTRQLCLSLLSTQYIPSWLASFICLCLVTACGIADAIVVGSRGNFLSVVWNWRRLRSTQLDTYTALALAIVDPGNHHSHRYPNQANSYKLVEVGIVDTRQRESQQSEED